MRNLVLALAAASLTLAGCNKKQATGNTNTIDQAVSAEDFATSDATAIDAATGADANMAADVDFNILDNADEGNGSATASSAPRSSNSKPKARTTSTSKPSQPAPAPAPEPLETTPLSNAG